MGARRVEDEYKKLLKENKWNELYYDLGQISNDYPYTINEAKKQKNKPMNRYRDVNPFDHSRVILQRGDTDYINANHVPVEIAKRRYILTQGPLMYTVGHFWTMVWEQDARVIVMLNKIVEKNEIKCHHYWPTSTEKKSDLDLADYNLHVALIWEEDKKYYTVRAIMLTDTETMDKRVIMHYHYTTWPDFEVPASPVEFLDFLKQVRATGVLDRQAPAIVHCSAGIGRSGTFCLVDSVLLLIEHQGQAYIDVQDMLLEMRKYRMGLIQTSEQLRFSYLAIVEGIKRLDPNYVPPPVEEAEYAAVANEEEEAPPPPPPRGESLGRPPARPLPAIPTSSSLENLEPPVAGTSSDEDAPQAQPLPVEQSSTEDEDEAEPLIEARANSMSSLEKAALRKRRIEDMSTRIANMKKRSREADRLETEKNEHEEKEDE